MTPNPGKYSDLDDKGINVLTKMDEKEKIKRGPTDVHTGSFWRSCRLFVAVCGSLVMCTSFASQASMTSAMVCMMKDDHNTNHNNTNNLNESILGNRLRTPGYNESFQEKQPWKFSWDSRTEGWVISSFFFGYYFMQLPSGVIVTRLGPKRSMVFGLFFTGVLHFLSIPAARWNLPLLYLLRTLAGLACGCMLPGTYALVGNWCPRQETTMMFGIACIGIEFGNSFSFLLSLIGCQIDFQGGWPIVFYTLGIIQILVGIVVCVAVSDYPSTHRFITDKESSYITKHRNCAEKVHVIPYGKILRSAPVWALLVAHFGGEYWYYTAVTQLPLYLRDILKLSHWQTNIISSVPYMLCIPFVFILSYASDKLVVNGVFSRTTVRKFNDSFSKITSAVLLVLLGYLSPGGSWWHVFFIYLAAAWGITVSYAGYMPNPGDLSPGHAGFLAALAQTLATWVSFVIPILTGNLTAQKTQQSWQILFYITFGLVTCCALFFLVFGSGNLQPWAITEDDETTPIVQKNGEKKNDKTKQFP